MTAGRGSQSKLVAIKEATFGTTPATPTMLEIPFNTFTPNVSISMIKSDQIRSHPYVDRLMQGATVTDHTLAFELQDDNHDILLETLTGSAWSSNVTTFADAIKSLTVEEQHADLTKFNVYTGTCVKQAQFTFPAAADGKVTCSMDLMSVLPSLDNGATAATVVTAATLPDPYVFHQAAMTIGGSAVKVTNATITAARQIDPLYILGARQPDEYIPAAVTVNGQVTIAYYDATQSTRLLAFTEGALAITCTQSGNSRLFTVPKMNFGKMSRPIQSRGVILQTIDWEAKYDSSSGSVMSITRT